MKARSRFGVIGPGHFVALPDLDPAYRANAIRATVGVLQYRPQIGRVAIERALGLGKTTLSRSLQLMQKNGWIEPTPSADGREHGYRLTPSGTRARAKTEPRWKRAQAKLYAALKPGEWEDMFKVAGRVAAAAKAAQHDLAGPKSSNAVIAVSDDSAVREAPFISTPCKSTRSQLPR
jgi:DNA-binding MarR family transcriptional regulator